MYKFEKIVNSYTFTGLEFGSRELPTLVCLHGTTGDSNSYLSLSKLLEEHFQLIVINLPGHGDTSSLKTEEEYLFSSIVHHIHKVVEDFTENPIILGHSLGADIALHYAKTYSDEVIGIILIDGGFVFPEEVDGMTIEKAISGWDEYMDKSVYNTWDEVVNDYQDYITGKWDSKFDDIIRSNFIKENDRYRLKADKFSILSIIKAFFKEPCSTTYKHIQCPVLFFHATEPIIDPSREKGLKKIKDHIKNLKVIGIENTKHMVHWDAPEKVAETIIAWEKIL